MLARLSATLLAVLTLAPFTAPFPTCDLATWLGASPEPARTNHSRSLTAKAADASLLQVRPLARTAGRTRMIALSGPGAVDAGRSLAAGVMVSTVHSAVSAPPISRTVLRI